MAAAAPADAAGRSGAALDPLTFRPVGGETPVVRVPGAHVGRPEILSD